MNMATEAMWSVFGCPNDMGPIRSQGKTPQSGLPQNSTQKLS